MTTRVTVDDLEFAAEWLDAYEGQNDDPNAEVPSRVAKWLRAEARRRRENATARGLAAEYGVTVARARQALRNASK